jgi:hypothetical protein
MTRKPRLVGGAALFCGYYSEALRGAKRHVSHELMRFHRHEQSKKLRKILGTLLRFKKVERYVLADSAK